MGDAGSNPVEATALKIKYHVHIVKSSKMGLQPLFARVL